MELDESHPQNENTIKHTVEQHTLEQMQMEYENEEQWDIPPWIYEYIPNCKLDNIVSKLCCIPLGDVWNCFSEIGEYINTVIMKEHYVDAREIVDTNVAIEHEDLPNIMYNTRNVDVTYVTRGVVDKDTKSS